jgi:hypothetical protein
MSSRQLEDRYEQEQEERLAEHLGLTVDELNELSPAIEVNESADGQIYNFVLNFSRDASRTLLAKVIGLEPGSLTMQVEIDVIDTDDDESEFTE